MQVISMSEEKIDELSDILKSNRTIEFQYKKLYYYISESSDYGYVINIYSSKEKDEDGVYLDDNMVDGGLCTGSSKDAIKFML